MVVMVPGAWVHPTQLTAQVTLQCLVHRARRAAHRLNVVLLEEGHGTPSHPSAQHDLDALTVDEGGHLTWGMVSVIRIVNSGDCCDFLPLYVNDDEVRTSAEVLADPAVQAIVVGCRNGDRSCLA